MPTTVAAYAARSATEPLAPITIDRRDVGPHDVRIDIKYAGICHSDIHTVRGEWGPVNYPLVPGHEIAGVVAEVGSAVTRFAVGDRVGVGCLVDSCGECDTCLRGEEQHCRRGAVQTYGAIGRDGQPTQGGYAESIVVTERFVCRIPDGLALDVAAPLLCAGITTYAPLRRWNAGPGKRVAVVGLGGLGHLAVKLAVAMGAEVTVLSQSLKKREEGLALGATGYHATSDPATFATLAGSFDLIVNTVSAAIDLDAYLSLLDVDGVLVTVGGPAEPMPVHAFSLTLQRRTIAGSLIGGLPQTQEMLDFCAEHGIGAEVEKINIQQINQAYERVLAADVRYRFVIDLAG